MTRAGPHDDAALKAADLLFRRECRFAAGADKPASLPEETLPEIAFAGRSNAGKSSLINALTHRKALARASRTPGRTQQINFFDLDGRLMLVDLPGYGYAAASKAKIESWNSFIYEYLRSRRSLKCVLLLLDARHGLKDPDRDAANILSRAGVAFMGVLTKADKAKPAELAEVTARVEAELRGLPGALGGLAVTSAAEKEGLADLRAAIAAMGE